MTRTRDEILESRRRLKAEYEALFDSVSASLYRHDPIGINFEENTDEYDLEARTILPRLRLCHTLEDVHNAVYTEFVRWFDSDTAGPERSTNRSPLKFGSSGRNISVATQSPKRLFSMQTLTGRTLSALLVACLIVLVSNCRAQTHETTITEPAPVKVEELFKQADLVAVVRVVSGDAEHYPCAVYKAKVLQAFKGTDEGSTVYFGPFVGYGVGEELLVFLRHSQKGIEPNQNAADPSLNYGPISSFYLAMYQGYGTLHIEYECVFDGKEIAQQCDYGVRVNTHQVMLPKTIKTFPSSTKGAFSEETNWVRKSVFVVYLKAAARLG